MDVFINPEEKKHLKTILLALTLVRDEHQSDKSLVSKVNSALAYLESKGDKKMTVNTYHLSMGMGQTNDWGNIPFLTRQDVKELNSIGYSGKDTKGKKMTWEAYLQANYPDRSFSMIRTGGNGGEFTDYYTLSVFG